jgi:hypothetical protein
MSGAAAPRQATGMTGDALAASNAWDPAASRQDALVSERSGLLDLADGKAIVIPGADLVQLANLRYEGPDPDADPDSISADRYALDMYWYRAGEARRIGGERARGMHYVLCRYLLPFLLEHRGEDGPLQAARLRISDVTTFVQVLAGERPLPAATVAADRLKRLAVTCHWLTLDDAAIACAIDRGELAGSIDGRVPVRLTDDGQPVVRAMDLRAAGMLIEAQEPHGLGRETADLVVQLLHATWRQAGNHGARMVGDPRSITAKRPLPANRQRAPKPSARVHVPLARCLEVAARLHPVHQRALWEGRFGGARQGEIFGCLVGDRENGLWHLRAIGGSLRDVRGVDGQFVRSDTRPGTKGSAEGEVDPGSRDASRQLRQRTVPLAPSLVAFQDEFDAIFHVDPATGAPEPWARAMPGLRTDDASGAGSFDSALKKACEETAATTAGPAEFTAHDLRASLNTDLENAGLDDRWLRHIFGHQSEEGRKLDVHDSSYDLGLSDDVRGQVAAAIQALIPDGVDLRVPTFRLPQIGPGTRHAGRMAVIEGELLRSGWYVPADGDPSGGGLPADGTEITTKVVADRLGLSGTHVSRMLETGDLPGRKVAKGGASIWLVPEDAVQAEFDRRERVRLPGLAAELGLSYHQLYGLIAGLGLASRRGMREAILLSADEIQRVRDEVERQAVARSSAMTHSEAARHLGVPDPLIQTLVRSRVLVAVESGSRTARVTCGSVEDYAAKFPARGICADEKVVAFADVREVLRVSRNAVSDLICTRRLTVIGIDRRQFVGSDSIVAYLEQYPCDGARERLARLEVSQP